MHPEFEHQDFQEYFWWDLDESKRVVGPPTGTPWQPAHRVEVRVGVNPFGRTIHKKCGGTIKHQAVPVWKEPSVSLTHEWDECETCHKKFNEEIW